ncbi:MAG: lipoprotein signal peptidase [Neisseria zoodegmatis]|uniref:lipoprotein signal peptidase n=1 Tax=Neisseria zoodegmatis TaxID=326523 RepID=UPI0026EC629F|nr:lipoprotein signal peptidase [Neisseria zoodegmatis]MDO5069800.1 lipoprotein signal peptidase [Neisseria zoodegmatis]
MQNPHLRRISALCAARSFAYLYDMSALAVLLRLELHPHLRVLQRSLPIKTLRPSEKVFGFQTACMTFLSFKP